MSLFHNLYQLSVAVHHVVLHLVRGNLGEEFSGALDFGLLDLPQVH